MPIINPKLVQKIPPSIGFSIYEDYMLKSFIKHKIVKVRLTLLRAVELAAQSNETDLKRRLAGYKALSSANPYPFLMIGDGKNDSNSGILFKI